MNIETIREYCLAFPGTEETFPFDEVTLVFKVMGKMFALLPLHDDPPRCNLKANPEWSEELREAHHQIIPGFHMNKKHWNTIYFEDGLDEELMTKMIKHSYDLVVSKLTKKLKAELEELK